MQFSQFTTGGFAVHHIPYSGNGRISAWFNPAGTLIDAEIIYPDGRTRPVKRYARLWKHASQWGGIFAARYRKL